MTEELIIAGQHADLREHSGITLEIKSGLFTDLSKLTTSYSYTITLPDTTRNRRIFDDPANTAYKSSKVRKMLPARYYLNGVDLLGESQVCLMSTGAEGFEIVLLPSYGEQVREWIEAEGNLQDLDLPTVTWAKDNDADYATATSPYDIFFPYYVSGLPSGSRESLGAVSHPVVSLYRILHAMNEAHPFRGIISARALHDLNIHVLLASTRKPSLAMELTSGSYAPRFTVYDGIDFAWSHGWDPAVEEQYSRDYIVLPESGKLGIFINVIAPSDMEVGDVPLVMRVGNSRKSFYFQRNDKGEEVCTVNAVIEGEAGAVVAFSFDAYGPTGTTYFAYDQKLPAFALYHSHDHINIMEQNEFPVALNLPDMKQVDFLKYVCAMFGFVAFVDRTGRLSISTYDELLDKTIAQDWTTALQSMENIAPTLDGFAHKNHLRFKEYESDFDLRRYDGELIVEDQTLAVSKDFVALPFSASIQRGEYAVAQHYSYTSAFNEETHETEYTVEDKSITPRVFGWVDDGTGKRFLNFVDYLAGDILVNTRYAKYQQVIRQPWSIRAKMRLSEMDIATLDIQRPVYLQQTGQYYSIVSLKYSPGEFSEVELIQIP